MKLIPCPELWDKVAYLGEGEPERGHIVDSPDQAYIGYTNVAEWQVQIKWDHNGQETVERAIWNDELKLWVAT